MGESIKEAVDKMIPEIKAKARKESLPWIAIKIRKLSYNNFKALKSINPQKIEMIGKHAKGSETKT